MKTRSFFAAAVLLFILPSAAFAGKLAEWTDFVIEDSKDIICRHGYDLYLPLYAWHNRLTYDREHIDRYNENPWGAGFGISRYNSEGTWSALYALYFEDSNSYGETYFGYARQWNRYAGENNAWHAGVGYALGLTQRHEYSYIPVPLPLPMAGAGYRNFELHAVYIPGIKNDGNVLFAFSRIHF